MDTTRIDAFVAALSDPSRTPSGLTSGNGDPAHRFGVYRNNVVVSLIEALATTFPVTEALVGRQFFRAMARIYARQSPPSSCVLADYGAGFPEFIEEFAPASELPYLADVARLEHLRVVAYHAADATVLPTEAFQALLGNSDRLFAARVELHPACRWLRSSHPVFSLWAAHQGVPDLHAVDLAVGEDALVIRPNCDVRVLSLPAGGVELLDALSGGVTLAEAIGHAASTVIDFDLPRQLAGLIENGLITRLIHPDGEPA